ncbi:MAG TPA: hypothetical protein VD973_24550 [Symbiobacteriaceae bacterium]|jgi:hypothetical protein|nr:hypothetical protein [Symbiobacteriaceae bacterium]
MQTLLLLAGGAVALYCLWQFRRWLGEPQESGPAGVQRLETLVDELVATAEATSAVVQEKAEALVGLLAEADRRIGALSASEPLAGAGRPSAGAQPEPAVTPEVSVAAPESASEAEPSAVVASAAVPSQAPVQAAAEAAGPRAPDLHRQVYELADAGTDVTAIARRLGLTKGEVQLILGIRK